MSHDHNFTDWPFDTPINTVSFTTKFVINGSRPVLEVYHDHDGDWQFLCGTTLNEADLKLVCMGCILERDSTIAELAQLLPGWRATRASVDHAWHQEAYEDTDESEHDA